MQLFEKLSEMGHEQVVICHDKSVGYKGIIAIHDTTLGPALGGTRFWRYESDEEAASYAARVGGAYIAEVLEAATGVNLWREWARLEIAEGKVPRIRSTRNSPALTRSLIPISRFPPMNSRRAGLF